MRSNDRLQIRHLARLKLFMSRLIFLFNSLGLHYLTTASFELPPIWIILCNIQPFLTISSIATNVLIVYSLSVPQGLVVEGTATVKLERAERLREKEANRLESDRLRAIIERLNGKLIHGERRASNRLVRKACRPSAGNTVSSLFISG